MERRHGIVEALCELENHIHDEPAQAMCLTWLAVHANVYTHRVDVS